MRGINMSIPAHKVIGDVGKPGQVTLADYIAKKDDSPKRITFKEWLKKSSFVEPDETVYCWLEDCWNAARKEGKL
jgi:hypothetical protein